MLKATSNMSEHIKEKECESAKLNNLVAFGIVDTTSSLLLKQLLAGHILLDSLGLANRLVESTMCGC